MNFCSLFHGWCHDIVVVYEIDSKVTMCRCALHVAIYFKVIRNSLPFWVRRFASNGFGEMGRRSQRIEGKNEIIRWQKQWLFRQCLHSKWKTLNRRRHIPMKLEFKIKRRIERALGRCAWHQARADGPDRSNSISRVYWIVEDWIGRSCFTAIRQQW